MRLLRNTLIACSAISSLLACTPTFQTTEQLCQANLPTRQVAAKYDVFINDDSPNDLEAPSNIRSADYQYYLADFLNSFKDLQSKKLDASGNIVLDENGNAELNDLSADEIAVRDFIFEKINQDMNYTLDDEGTVVSASNPLDYMANIISAIDEDVIVQTFVEAKQQMAAAIAKDDGHCTYSNEQIEFIREDDSQTVLDLFSASLNLTYVPSAFAESNNDVDQTIIINLDTDPTSEEDNEVQYSAIDRITPEDFESSGYSEANIRQIRVFNEEPPEIMTVDDDFESTKIATMGYAIVNDTCKDDTEDENVIPCPEGSVTKPVEHPFCDGTEDDDGNEETENEFDDETGTVLINNFTISENNDDLKDLHRLRVEVDYPENEIRVYVSKFSEAIYKALTNDSEGNRVVVVPQGDENPTPTDDQLILNPTTCETNSVSRDLFNLNDETTTPATAYLDPGYEYIDVTDENGDVVIDDDGFVVQTPPTPLFIFQGTSIEGRNQ